MAPKSRRSPSPKKSGAPSSSTVEDSERPSKDAARAQRFIEASKPKEHINYDGPRPDEELLHAIRIEIEEGQKTKKDLPSIENIYAFYRTGWQHRLQDEQPLGPERLHTVDVNQRSLNGYTALLMASAAGKADMVSLLLERRADVSISTSTRADLPIHLAAQGGYDVVTRLLVDQSIAKGLINTPNLTGWTPLHFGVIGQNLTVMAILLRAGADVNVRNPFLGDPTALHVACRLGWRDGMESLINREANVNLLDRLHRAPLHWAAARADPKAVSLLLRSKADVNSSAVGQPPPLQMVPRDYPDADPVSSFEEERTAHLSAEAVALLKRDKEAAAKKSAAERAAAEKVRLLLQSYNRAPPPGVRTDPHFEHFERPKLWDIPVSLR
eukprot:TRINITY_DN103892_c0_g1_i1.p1 TRINITY_DN103892_c0_g1~~TRINITY_DN103892_c0_g1_i1.p1  ORF type:complete len:384 (-),score=74.21 TRINITY_DN103892_c0_g1_i1:22-1173(-)